MGYLIIKLSREEMKSNNNPWLTKGILKSINQKNAVYRKFIRAKNYHSKEIYHLELKQYKSMINSFTRINKSKYYKIFFSKLKTNSKQARSSHRRCSVRKGVLRNLAKFTGKHLYLSPFFNKEAFNCIKKETLAEVFSCEICKISKNTFFTEHL